MKRLLFLVHRWAGVVLALFMALWFISGLVILYAPHMGPDRGQQLAHGELLAPEPGWLSLGQVWRRADAVGDARLVRQAREPLWLVDDLRGLRFAFSAIDGSLQNASAKRAVSIAEAWVHAEGIAPSVRYLETIDKPALLRNQESLRPFHRIAIGDGDELLISARSGEVVVASTRIGRAMYWAGNWLHMFRFLDAFGAGNVRVDVLTWTVFAAFVAVLAGLVVGWLRWRPGWFGKPTYAEGRSQPYRAFWFRWHFWSGLIGGLFALGWALGGFLNGNPWQVFSPGNPAREDVARYFGAGLPAAMGDWKPVLPLGAPVTTVELRWRRLGDEGVLLAYDRSGAAVGQGFSDAGVLAAVGRLAPNVSVAAQTLQTDYDSYYSPRQNRSAVDRPLPVLRVDLDDAAGTRVYVDPQDGRLLLRQDRSRRVHRWLFAALHFWDFGWLRVRPLWDAWMLIWVGFGVVLSVSSLVVGWRRLRLTLAGRRKKREWQEVPSLAEENRAG
jgi:uncharacterized iron-regulated membrane protein